MFHNTYIYQKSPIPTKGINQTSTLTTSLEANLFCFVSTSLVFLKVQYIVSASQGWTECVFSPNSPQPSGKGVLPVCLFNFYVFSSSGCIPRNIILVNSLTTEQNSSPDMTHILSFSKSWDMYFTTSSQTIK